MHTTNGRKFERHEFQTENIRFFLDAGYQAFQLKNISKGGLYFLSDVAYPTGHRMTVNLENLFELEVEVVHQEMIITDESFMEAKYKIGCQFHPNPLDEEMFLHLVDTLSKLQSKSQP